MSDPGVPLLSLADGRAPYKGIWQLVQHGAGARAKEMSCELEAIHTTYHPAHSPGCEIERLSFAEQGLARQFVRHLLLHNWCVHNVSSAGEAFWVELPS